MKKCPEPAVVVAVARPNGRIQAEQAHVLQRLFGEKVVQDDNASVAIEIVGLDPGGIPFIGKRSRHPRRRSYMNDPVVDVTDARSKVFIQPRWTGRAVRL